MGGGRAPEFPGEGGVLVGKTECEYCSEVLQGTLLCLGASHIVPRPEGAEVGLGPANTVLGAAGWRGVGVGVPGLRLLVLSCVHVTRHGRTGRSPLKAPPPPRCSPWPATSGSR